MGISRATKFNTNQSFEISSGKTIFDSRTTSSSLRTLTTRSSFSNSYNSASVDASFSTNDGVSVVGVSFSLLFTVSSATTTTTGVVDVSSGVVSLAFSLWSSSFFCSIDGVCGWSSSTTGVSVIFEMFNSIACPSPAF